MEAHEGWPNVPFRFNAPMTAWRMRCRAAFDLSTTAADDHARRFLGALGNAPLHGMSVPTVEDSVNVLEHLRLE